MSNGQSLTRYAWISVLGAVVTIAVKAVAYYITGSVGLLSDALESLVNLLGAALAVTMLTVAERPPDEEHAFGHGKAEYFSSGAEGAMIVIAAASIAVAAVHRLIHPAPLESLGIGTLVSMAASGVNLAVAMVMLRAGRLHGSVTLEANGKHLLTDVWTSAGVIVGLGAVAVTGWGFIDPVVALLVAANIVRTGVGIIHNSLLGLMDTALPAGEEAAIRAVLDGYAKNGIAFHALRTRQAGMRRFVMVHVLVPGRWTVQRGHQMLEKIERDIRGALPNTAVFTHLESLNDPASWEDTQLDRPEPAGTPAK